jgi:hypothetical protein
MVFTGTPAMLEHAVSSRSWTAQPAVCVCQPQKALPSYSMPKAILTSGAPAQKAHPGKKKPRQEPCRG